MSTQTLFENYSDFVNNEENDLQTPSGAVRLLREDASFNDFVDTLTDGLDDNARSVAQNVLERQREQLLGESANVASSVFTHKILTVG